MSFLFSMFNLYTNIHCLWIILLIFNESKGSRYLITHLSELGLANRLKAIADMAKIATLSDRKLLISWIPNKSCNASFHDLFDVNMMPSSMQLLELNDIYSAIYNR